MPAPRGASHRARGWLRDLVRRSLETRPAPVSAHRLALELQAGDPGVHESAVFRAVRELEQAGVVRRLATSKSYVLRRPGEIVDLLCQACGEHEEHAAVGLSGPVEQLARSVGFTATRLVAEVIGTCRRCAEEPATG